MHAPLRPLEIRQQRIGPPQHGTACARQRVEHAHLYARHKGQPHDLRIRTRAVEVVQQHPHPHATPRRLHHAAQQALRALVGMDGVVLQVQRLLRTLDQGQPCAVGGLGAGQEGEGGGLRPDAGWPQLLHQRAQWRALRSFQGGGDGAIDLRGQAAGAAADHGGHQQDKRGPQASEEADGWKRL